MGGVIASYAPAPTVAARPFTGSCSGPITITSGGQLTGGCYESTNPATPAITIATTQPVWLDHVLVRHRGFGVFAQATTDTNVAVTHSTFMATCPASVVDQLAIYLLQPDSLVAERNRFVDGHGVGINGDNLVTSLLRVNYNDYIDIGRWDTPGFIGAFHSDKGNYPNGAEVGWNRIKNHRGRSIVEDCIGMTQTNGASGAPVDIHHNLIDGCYPYSGDGAGFTGGAIDLGDLGGSWQSSHDNFIVRATNNGLMIPAGSNLHHYANRVVNSGIADDGARCSSTFGAGAMVWDNPDPSYPPIVSSDVYDHLLANGRGIAHRRWNGTAWERNNFIDFFLPNCDPAGNCTGGAGAVGPTNDIISITLADDAAWLAAVQAVLDDWETLRVASRVTIGPQ